MERLDLVLRFVPQLLGLFREVKNLTQIIPGFKCFFRWLPGRKTRVFILLFQVDTHEYHLLSVKISERRWPNPPSRVRQLYRTILRTVERELRRYLPYVRNRTYCIIGRFTKGSLRRPTTLIKGVASSEMTMLLDVRRVNPVRKIREVLSKLYEKRARKLREAVREGGLEEPYGHLKTLIQFYTDISRVLTLSPSPGPPPG